MAISVSYTHLDVYKRQQGTTSNAVLQQAVKASLEEHPAPEQPHTAGNAPVSYTHLDVYKRQGLANAGDAGDVLRTSAVACFLAAAVDEVLSPDALAAVQGAHTLGACLLYTSRCV